MPALLPLAGKFGSTIVLRLVCYFLSIIPRLFPEMGRHFPENQRCVAELAAKKFSVAFTGYPLVYSPAPVGSDTFPDFCGRSAFRSLLCEHAFPGVEVIQSRIMLNIYLLFCLFNENIT
jgi:hypothetical protein